jgi:dephospho-CoA kinase
MVDPATKPELIGLLGGVASGKSFVAELLARQGAIVLDADRIGHEVLRDPAVKAECRSRWGDDIFAPDGEIDRVSLAKIVFAQDAVGQSHLRSLEAITHPRIQKRLLEQLESLVKENPGAVAILDAPIMLKAGWDKPCSHIIFVDAPRDIRLARARSRGWTEANFTAREAAQEPLETKRKLADLVIDNSGSFENTERQVEAFWAKLKAT